MAIAVPAIIKKRYQTDVLDFEIICEKIYHDFNNIGELIEYSVSNDNDAWVCAWILSKYAQKYNNSLSEYSNFFIENLQNIKRDGQVRQILTILQNSEISEEKSIELFNTCIDIFQNNKVQSSVRVSAFQLLLKICDRHNELLSEIEILFDTYKNSLTEGIRHALELRFKKYRSVMYLNLLDYRYPL